MSDENARALEAILMVAPEPVETHLLAQLLEMSQEQVEQVASDLQASYEAEDRGFLIAKVAGGYRFQSHPDLAPYVERFILEGQSARLSSAALETLAIVAYKQPLSRAQIAAIRGVSVDGVMRTLQQRGYIEEVARDPGPGQAVLFGTSREFLARLGLDSLDDLPSVADLVPGPDVVEALEQGLRADPLDAAPVVAPGADPEPHAVRDADHAGGHQGVDEEGGGDEGGRDEGGRDEGGRDEGGRDGSGGEAVDVIEEPAWMSDPTPSNDLRDRSSESTLE